MHGVYRIPGLAGCLLIMTAGPAAAEPFSMTTFIVSALFAVASSVALGLLIGRPDPADRDKQDFNLQALPRSEEGAPIPIIYGQARITGLNTIGHGGESARTVWERIDGGFFASDKHVAVAYDYYLDIAFGVCLGEIEALQRVWIDNSIAVNGYYGVPGDSLEIAVNLPAFFGGKGQGGGLGGIIRIYRGQANQPRDPTMQEYLGASSVPGFHHQVNMIFTDDGGALTDGRGFYWGERAFLPSLSVELRRVPNPLSLSIAGIPKDSNRHMDANPANVIYDLLTNTIQGGKLEHADIDIWSFRRAGERLYDERHGYSTAFIQAQETREMIRDITTQIGAIVYQDHLGATKLRLIREDYIASSTPLITGEHILAGTRPEIVRRNTDSEINQVKVVFPDWTRNYEDATATEQDDASIEDLGRIRTHQVRMRGISTLELASRVATRLLNELTTPLLHLRASLVADAFPERIEPGDIFRFTYEPDGITEAVMRVSRVEYRRAASGTFSIFIVATQDQYSTQDALFDPPDESPALPHPELRPLAALEISELPYWLARWHIGSRTTAGNNPDEPYLYYAGRRDPADEYATGFRPEITRPGASRVSEDAECVFNFGGTVRATVDAFADSMIVENLIGTDIITGELFPSNTDDDLRNGRRLIMVSGPGPLNRLPEILGYRSAIPLGGGAWQLSGLERGMVDTQGASILSGTRVWFLGTEIPNNFGVLNFRANDQLKVQARTISAFGSLDPAQNFPDFTLDGRAARPLSPRLIPPFQRVTSIDGTPRLLVPLRHRNRLAPLLSLEGDQQDPERSYAVTYRIGHTGGFTTTFLRDDRERHGGYTLALPGYGVVSIGIWSLGSFGYSATSASAVFTFSQS